uniref:Uncharacterized protein n=1 Tax=Anguilla anguilla TaxID=7936 RepID=A0A0E9UY23_ANGAN
MRNIYSLWLTELYLTSHDLKSYPSVDIVYLRTIVSTLRVQVATIIGTLISIHSGFLGSCF